MRLKTDPEPISRRHLFRAGYAAGMLRMLRAGSEDDSQRQQIDEVVELCLSVPGALNNYEARRTLQRVERLVIQLFGLRAG